MSAPPLPDAAVALARLGGRLAAWASDLFLNPASAVSLLSLAGGLLLAVAVLTARRLRRRGRVSARLLWRALRPRAGVFAASGRADLGWFLFNTLSVGLLIGWAILSQNLVRDAVAGGLEHALGPQRPWLSGWLAGAMATVLLFLAYDLGYWVDHWLSHRVPALWEIHKVHHTAEALSPLTVFRVHPLESLKFYNVLALSTGVVDGVLRFGLGPAHGKLHLLGADAAWMVFACTVLHLQHSHVWISFPGRLGRLLMSPAHHQVHHSAEARHFGKNLGNAFAVWDWLAGSLYVPPAEREAFRFGVEGAGAEAHTVTGSLVTPIANALRAAARVARPAAPVDFPVALS